MSTVAVMNKTWTRRNRAFGMIETLVTFVVIAIVAGGAVFFSQRVVDESSNLGGAVLLQTARAETANAAYNQNSVFPESFTDLSEDQLSYTTNQSTGNTVVSYHRVSDTVVILAATTQPQGCIYVINSLTEKSLWGADESGNINCTASVIAANTSALDATTSKDSKNPSTVDLG